jgi:hypothetical protein
MSPSSSHSSGSSQTSSEGCSRGVDIELVDQELRAPLRERPHLRVHAVVGGHTNRLQGSPFPNPETHRTAQFPAQRDGVSVVIAMHMGCQATLTSAKEYPSESSL